MKTTYNTKQPGEVLIHPRFGECELIRIDNDTYSIAMAVVVVKGAIESIEAGTPICRPLAEFE